MRMRTNNCPRRSSAEFHLGNPGLRRQSLLNGTWRLAMVMATFCFALGIVTPTKAQITIDTPPGLVPGDTFRIVFATIDTTMAVLPNIGIYNTFVNTDATMEAGGGAVTYDGTPLMFKAIASTLAVDAIDNIGVTNSPVYLFDGVKIANTDSATGLWSGSILTQIDASLTTNVWDTYVWTGTTESGTAALDLGSGTEEPATLGYIGDTETNITSALWVNASDDLNDMTYPMYGISQMLTVPEPATISMALVASAVLMLRPRNSKCREYLMV
jgi:hypothetical protein